MQNYSVCGDPLLVCDELVTPLLPLVPLLRSQSSLNHSLPSKQRTYINIICTCRVANEIITTMLNEIIVMLKKYIYIHMCGYCSYCLFFIFCFFGGGDYMEQSVLLKEQESPVLGDERQVETRTGARVGAVPVCPLLGMEIGLSQH